MKANICFYINLINDLIEGNISPLSFEIVFPYVFNRDNNLTAEEYEILNKLFYASEDYVSNPDIRNEGDLDDVQLVKVAQETLINLNNKSCV